jgi:rod shape-determining protein MreD
MSYYVGPVLVFLFALIEAAVMPMFRVSGLQPNLVLVLLVAWLMVRGAQEAFLLTAVGGLSLGFVEGAAMGTALLALAPIVLLQEARGAQLREGGIILTTLFVVVMTFSYGLTYFLAFTVGGQGGDLLQAISRVIIPTAFLNVIVLLPIYAVLVASSQELRRAGYV